MKHAKHAFLKFFGDARTVVVDRDLDSAGGEDAGRKFDRLPMDGGVHHQVGERALQGVGADLGLQVGIGLDADLGPCADGALADLVDQRLEGDGLDGLAALAAPGLLSLAG